MNTQTFPRVMLNYNQSVKYVEKPGIFIRTMHDPDTGETYEVDPLPINVMGDKPEAKAERAIKKETTRSGGGRPRGNSKYKYEHLEVGESIKIRARDYAHVRRIQSVVHSYGRKNERRYESRQTYGALIVTRIK